MTLLKAALAITLIAAGTYYVSAQLAPAKTTESKRPGTKIKDGTSPAYHEQSWEQTRGAQTRGSSSPHSETSEPARPTAGTTATASAREPQARGLGTVDVNAAKRQQANGMRAGEIDQGELVIPLHREAVDVSKRVVDDGAVRLRKVVRTDSINQPVDLRREMVVVERIPQGERAGQIQATSGIPGAFEEGEIVIPIAREEPSLNKRVIATDQVVARTNIETNRQNVRENVRTETVEFIDRGDPNRVRVIGEIAETKPAPAKDPKQLASEKDSRQVARYSPNRP